MAKQRKRAGIYTRISRDSSLNGERQGVERQREDCEWLCEINNYEIVDYYEDNSISAHGTVGKKAKERPEFERLKRDFDKNRLDVVVCFKLDRLCRSVLSFETMLQELAEQELVICTTEMGEIDLTRSDSLTIARMLTNFAELESSRKGERTKRANKQRAEKGIMRRGTRLFGYDTQGRVIPHEAEIIRAIYDNYSHGSSIGTITRAIAGHDDGTLPNMPISEAPSYIFLLEKEERDVADGKDPTKRGDKYLAYREKTLNLEWSRSTTAAMLRNPRYAGYMYRAESVNGKSQPYNSDWRKFIVRDDNGDYVKGRWEPIIDEELWWRVQERRDANLIRADGVRIEKKGNVKKRLGANLYRCIICGKTLKTGSAGRSKDPAREYTYRCDGHVNRMGYKIDEFVIGVIKNYLSRADLKDILFKPVDNTSRLAEIGAEIKEINGLIAQTNDNYIHSRLPTELIDLKLDKLYSDRKRLEDEQNQLRPDNPAMDIINAPSPAEAFAAITDAAQMSEIVDFLCTIKIKPHPRGKRVTPDSLMDTVIFDWKVNE